MKKLDKSVLIVTSHFPPNLGGVESHLQSLVTTLIKNKWKVYISTYKPLASNKKAPFVEKSESLTIYRFPWLGFNVFHAIATIPPLEFLFLFPGLLIMTFIVLLKHAKNIRVIHAQGLVPSAVGLVARLFFQKRLVSSIHNLYFFPDSGLYPKAAKFIFSSVDVTLCPTKVASNELTRVEVPKEKLGKFSYWLSLDTFKPQAKLEAKRKLGWKKFTVFFVGRLIDTKGVEIILELVKVLNPEIQLVVAGDGPLSGEMTRAQNISSNLKYLGRVENTNLPEYYSASDLVIVPSLVDEGWGYVAMEAISCGTPVIASKVGGLSDVVSSRVGKLIEPTVVNFKRWIEHYFHHKKDLNRLRKNTRRYAVANFGESSVKKIISAYEK